MRRISPTFDFEGANEVEDLKSFFIVPYCLRDCELFG